MATQHLRHYVDKCQLLRNLVVILLNLFHSKEGITSERPPVGIKDLHNVARPKVCNLGEVLSVLFPVLVWEIM